jgi:hypothetical protein
MSSGKRLTYGYVRESFAAEGYILLSSVYINNLQKLTYICPKGHTHSISWSNWLNGHRCAKCAGNIKCTLITICRAMLKEGYTLLSDKYTNQKTKLEYKCPLGHVHTMTWTDWNNGGYRCPTCHAIKITGSGNPSWKGGVSLKPYCDAWKDKVYKEAIKYRDNNICRNPCCFGVTKELTIHHINYDKEDCRPINLITICRSCNSRANTDRTWHKNWYSILMCNRERLLNN